MNTVKTVYTIIAASIFAVAAASAAPKPREEASLKLDDKSKPGQLIISHVASNAAALGIVPGDVLLEVCTVPADSDHVAEIQALVRSAGTKPSRGKTNEMCAPVKNILEKLTVDAPYAMRGAKVGYQLENTMKFRHENGKVFTVRMKDTNSN